jgi:hypothetical protein
VLITPVPFVAAAHELLYVRPSHPQTGSYTVSQISGRGWQKALASAAPQYCPSSYAQYSLASQVGPANPPQARSWTQGRDVQSQAPFWQEHVLQLSAAGRVSPSLHVCGF